MIVIQFYQEHQAVLNPLVVALIDFAIEMNPSWKSNGIVSAVLSFFKKKEGTAA